MTYKEAIALIRKGGKVRRPHWHPCRTITINQKGFCRSCADGKPTNWWEGRSEDREATDWEEVTDVKTRGIK